MCNLINIHTYIPHNEHVLCSSYASPASLPGAPMSTAAVAAAAAAAALPPIALPSDGEDRIRVACRVKPREQGTSAAKICTSVGGDQRTVAWAGDRADGRRQGTSLSITPRERGWVKRSSFKR